MLNKLDIIIFGATGFTGRRIIPQLNQLIKSEKLSLSWGIAGRSQQKLKDVLKEAEKESGDDLSSIAILTADVYNEPSLVEMTSKARVVINATGPYRFYGEPVVKACLITATHYIDVTGEPEFMEQIQLNYHEEALRKKVYLISSCGMDSIPCEMGAIFLMKNFIGTLNSIETYIHMMTVGGPYPGPVLNYTTWESAVHGVSNTKKLSEIRSKLSRKKLPRCEPQLRLQGQIFKNNITGKWCSPYPGADRSVMLRTQKFLYRQKNQRPIQVHCYYEFDNFYNAFLSTLMGSIFITMCKYNWTRSLLLKHPKLFSLGVFTLGGPSDEKQENTLLNVFLEGKGWSETSSESTDQFQTIPNKTILARISAKNVYGGITSTAVVFSAIMILMENEKLPDQGGCYTPGFAFANTSLIEKLDKYGVKFELQSKL